MSIKYFYEHACCEVEKTVTISAYKKIIAYDQECHFLFC